MEIASKQYPYISYQPNKDLTALPLETGLPFTLEINGSLTGDRSAMQLVGEVLDNFDIYFDRLKGYLAIAALDEQDDRNWAIAQFFKDYIEKSEKKGWGCYRDSDRATGLSASYLEIVVLLQPQFLRYSFIKDLDDDFFTLGLSFRPDEDGNLLIVTFEQSTMCPVKIEWKGPWLAESQWHFMMHQP